MAAVTLMRSRTYPGAQYRRLRTKLGAPKAITAMAHRLARLVYRMLKYGQAYVDKGLSTMRNDSANNKSNYSEKEPPNLDSRSRRFTLERVFGDGMSRTFFLLRRKRGYGSRHRVPA